MPALRSLCVARLRAGGVFGTLPVATIAFATAHHGRAFSGLLLGVWGASSAMAPVTCASTAQPETAR